MISFKRLGKHGRLGNQLFQYAFLRLTAQRLGVKFYCPKWIGDEIFLLKDGNERYEEPVGITKIYIEPNNFGFNQNALRIEDRTDISGYFQTAKYLNENVKSWYTFKESIVETVQKKYKHIDFSRSVGIHLRFGDNISVPSSRLRYYILPGRYYSVALQKIHAKENILVFSDDMEEAKRLLKGIGGNILYMVGNLPYEDLYLMTRCRDFVCSLSTLSWWGAWLNSYSDKTIVVPAEGPVRPGAPIINRDFWPEEWIKVRALRGMFNGYRTKYLISSIRRKINRLKFLQVGN